MRSKGGDPRAPRATIHALKEGDPRAPREAIHTVLHAFQGRTRLILSVDQSQHILVVLRRLQRCKSAGVQGDSVNSLRKVFLRGVC